MRTDAPTIAQAMEEIKDSMVSAFKLYLQHGEEIPQPLNESQFKGQISYRTTPQRHCLLAREAQTRAQSLSKVIDDFIDKALNKS